MLDQLSLEYSCSGGNIAFLEWNSIEICKNYTLLAVTPGNDDLLSQYCTSTFPCANLHQKYWWFDKWSKNTIAISFRQGFGLKKNSFSSLKIKWMTARTSSHHRSSHPSANNSHTKFGLTLTLLTIWVRQVLGQIAPKIVPFSHHLLSQPLKPEFLP